MSSGKSSLFSFFNLKNDLSASLVVYLVALPLCLGIALASDATPFSGIIAGIVGGIVVGTLSGSNVSVSGPAAGLTIIVAGGIASLGGFEFFLSAVVAAGLIQLLLGFLKAGVVSHFFPSSVIKGMLAAIGLILILKQIPHALGYDADFEGDESFIQPNQQNTFSDIWFAIQAPELGAVLIAVIAFICILIWQLKPIQRVSVFKLIPGSLLAVVVGVMLNLILKNTQPHLALAGDHLVQLPAITTPADVTRFMIFPDFSKWLTLEFWIVALTIAIVASIESLLSLEASDKLDPMKRISNTNRELVAQGVGNMVSGFLGGLPLTAVIVRSSANITGGALTRISAVVHGILLLLSVLFFSAYLNYIPKSALAAILIVVGYKLTKPALFTDAFKKGYAQFVPFVVTVVAILLTDLLKGIAIGMVLGVLFVLISNYKSALHVTIDGNQYLIRFKKDVSFLNKAELRKLLMSVPNGAYVIFQAPNTLFMDEDILETIEDFKQTAVHRNIQVEYNFKQR